MCHSGQLFVRGCPLWHIRNGPATSRWDGSGTGGEHWGKKSGPFLTHGRGAVVLPSVSQRDREITVSRASAQARTRATDPDYAEALHPRRST
jgi:hypothetical protein